MELSVVVDEASRNLPPSIAEQNTPTPRDNWFIILYSCLYNAFVILLSIPYFAVAICVSVFYYPFYLSKIGATLVKWERQRVHVVQCGIMTVPRIHFNPFCVRIFGEIGSPVSFTKRVRVFGEIGSSVSFTKHSAPHVKKTRAQDIIRVRKKTN